MVTRTSCTTAEDLFAMPDDGMRRELIRGEVRMMTPAGSEHGDIASEIGWRLAQHVHEHRLGKTYAAETGFKIASDPDTVRAPDAAFVRTERVEQAGRVTGYFPGAPDLAVEVVSPNDRYSELHEKILEWLRAGTRMVIVVDPRERTAMVYRSLEDITVLTEDREIDGADVVPGWRVPVRELFG